MEVAAAIAKLGALAVVAGVFVYGLVKDWEGVWMVFGAILMLGSCRMLGVP